MGTIPFSQDDDCLTLSVWTPAPDAARRPVFVRIQSGACTKGGGCLPFYWAQCFYATIASVKSDSRRERLGENSSASCDGMESQAVEVEFSEIGKVDDALGNGLVDALAIVVDDAGL